PRPRPWPPRVPYATLCRSATGAAVQATLSERARATPGITFFENHMLVDLIVDSKLPGMPADGSQPRCHGAYVLDVERDTVDTFRDRKSTRLNSSHVKTSYA